jgi:hypothetical protein
MGAFGVHSQSFCIEYSGGCACCFPACTGSGIS